MKISDLIFEDVLQMTSIALNFQSEPFRLLKNWILSGAVVLFRSLKIKSVGQVVQLHEIFKFHVKKSKMWWIFRIKLLNLTSRSKTNLRSQSHENLTHENLISKNCVFWSQWKRILFSAASRTKSNFWK